MGFGGWIDLKIGHILGGWVGPMRKPLRKRGEGRTNY